jgi:hypothetical protein
MPTAANGGSSAIETDQGVAYSDGNVKPDPLRPGLNPGAAEPGRASRHAAEFDRLFLKQLQHAATVGSLVKKSARLQESVRDQRAALAGLRDVLARLRAELQSTRRTLPRPSPAAKRLEP